MNVNSQSELDINGRETCLCTNEIYFVPFQSELDVRYEILRWNNTQNTFVEYARQILLNIETTSPDPSKPSQHLMSKGTSKGIN